MMTSVNIQLIFHCAMIILSLGFSEAKAQVYNPRKGNQTRDVYYSTTFDQDISRRSRSSTELPVAFKAPGIESQNFWNYNPQERASDRTFFEDFKYLNYGNSNVFPNLNSFFDFMSPLFDRERTVKPKAPPASKPLEPYKYESPFTYLSSTERNFLPPPKPLKASIVKLETITRAPDWQVPFRYVPYSVQLTQPNIQSRPTDKTPTFFIDGLGFHSDHNINFKGDSNWSSPKIPSKSFDAQEMISTDLNFNGKSTPTISQDVVKNDNQSHTTFTTTLISIVDATEPTYNFQGKTEEMFSTFTDDSVQKNSKKGDDEEDSQKTLQLVINNTLHKYNRINNSKINRVISNNTVNDKAEETELDKNVRSHKKGNAIKIVTDLTLEGLQKYKKNGVNVPRYTKLLNMSNLISYELNKLKQNKLMKPRSNITDKTNKYYNAKADEFINDNDELSLDLKILKDTNWDGFTTESSKTFSSSTPEINSNAKQPVIIGENTTLTIQNNSMENFSENKDNIKNQTIIVETRVTKSVSKLLPGKIRYNRQYYQILGGRDPRKETDSTWKTKTNVRLQPSNLKVDATGDGRETNVTEDNSMRTSEEKEKNQDEENNADQAVGNQAEQTVNGTVITLGKKIEVSQENSKGNIERSEEGNIRRKYRPFLWNRSSFRSSTNAKETIPVPAQHNIEKKDANSTAGTYTENPTHYVTTATTEGSQPNDGEIFVGMKIHRRKLKKTSKSKRRRTGKRRKSSSTTEKQPLTEESISIV